MINRKTIISLLLLLFAAVCSYGQVLYYTSSNLNLRCGPGTNYKVITVIPQNVTIELTTTPPTWLHVSYNGVEGYINTKYLKHYSGMFNDVLYKVSDNEYVGKKTTNNYTYSNSGSDAVRYYTNVNGSKVQAPTHYNAVPNGATALCRDGTYSFSRNRRGTCSHHGGVLRWL